MSTRKLNSELQDIKRQVSSEPTSLSSFDIHTVHVTDLKIVWIEELPANSGSGRIERRQSQLNIDDGDLLLTDLVGWLQKQEQPLGLQFEGRTADGIIKASGEINPFRLLSDSAPSMKQVGWMPAIEGLTVYLENVDTNAFGNMVPDSLFQPINGKMTGELVLGLSRDGMLDYDVEMQYTDVRWAVNENSSLYKTSFRSNRERAKAQEALAGFSKSGKIKASSRGRVEDEEFRVVPSIQTSLTRQALATSPKAISSRAAKDQFRFEDKQTSPVAAQLQEASAVLAPFQQAAQEVNALKRSADAAKKGFRSVKGAIGNLFKK
jgi:hypothetical protein